MSTKPRGFGVILSDQQFQAIARALADPRRFAILQQVAAGPALACSALVQQNEITPPTISHHLKELSEAGLIAIKREGRTARLSFHRPVWKAYCKRLAAL